MAMYRTYFLNEENRIRAAEDIAAEHPAEAVEKSLAMLAQRPHHRGIEVWREERRIYPAPQADGHDGAAGAGLAHPVSDTVVFLRLAAIELRRLAGRAPEIGSELLRVAEQSEVQAADLLASLPPDLRARLSGPADA